MGKDQWPHRVAIVGLGLIGGSLALAIRRAHPGIELVGVDCDEDALAKALKCGAIAWGTQRLEEGVARAQLVVLATPVSAILELLPRLYPLIAEGTIVTDTGSTKRRIFELAERVLPQSFIGGHPMAGSERRGFEAARADLFEGTVYVLTPGSGRPDGLARRLANFLETLGVRTLFMTPERHDRIVAFTSHLPQLLSIMLGSQLSRKAEGDPTYLELIAGGTSDWLRIASSPYEIWRDVFVTNADEVEPLIRELAQGLEALCGSRLAERLEVEFRRARQLRTRLGR